ncbi:hypothetical protein [Corynebacterium uterequi]|uniref:Uncharacterized protein n=1 Tax=Corynebacterium uterequi TaxID=1072256 RepID=A0A0G3HB37_9CORY|nr:hypothetical protein [Corynebacterium uterequi]AKK10601.1 hypothetical protein CUTER_02940 [Corynebacterium uterequi]
MGIHQFQEKSFWFRLGVAYPIAELLLAIISILASLLLFPMRWDLYMFLIAFSFPVALIWKWIITLFRSRFAWVHIVLGVVILVLEYRYLFYAPTAIGDKLFVSLALGIIYPAIGEILRAAVRKRYPKGKEIGVDSPSMNL